MESLGCKTTVTSFFISESLESNQVIGRLEDIVIFFVVIDLFITLIVMSFLAPNFVSFHMAKQKKILHLLQQSF